MTKFLISFVLGLLSTNAFAESFFERVKINGFRCDHGKAGILLKSLEEDRILYLAKNINGDPKHLEMIDQQCKDLIKNLSNRFSGKILDVEFLADSFSKKESVYIPPTNPCRIYRRKCDDTGDYVERIFNYLRIETTIDGYRFFGEERLGQ